MMCVFATDIYKKASVEVDKKGGRNSKRGAIAPLFSDWQSVSVYLAQRWLDRLTNRRGQCQRDNQQSEDDTEGHVEAAEQRGNQRTADAADTET